MHLVSAKCRHLHCVADPDIEHIVRIRICPGGYADNGAHVMMMKVEFFLHSVETADVSLSHSAVVMTSRVRASMDSLRWHCILHCGWQVVHRSPAILRETKNLAISDVSMTSGVYRVYRRRRMVVWCTYASGPLLSARRR